MTSVTSRESTISSTQSLSSTLDSNLKNSSTRISICFDNNSVSNEVTVYGSVSSPITCSQPSELPNSIDSGAECYYVGASDLVPTNICPANVSLLNALIRGYNDKAYTPALSSICGNELEHIPYKKGLNMIDSVQNQTNALRSDDNARALKLAVDLTMINLNKTHISKSPTPSVILNKRHEQIKPNSLHTPTYSPESPYHMTSKKYLQSNHHTIHTTVSLLNQNTHKVYKFDINDASRNSSIDDVDQSIGNSVFVEDRSKKSQNMTECVPVPSSEHVAEIVGRQGCKIKALRAKTNTYIKTPVRNEEPVFVVTGRKEDVSKAKLEILSAAEHFTVIRATRRLTDNVANSNIPGNKQHVLGLTSNLSSTSQMQGQVTIQVRVPYRLVGLVVGTKGNTIKHIQQETQTYIVTPSRDKEPIFEVTGLADNVELARKHIEIHLATRIGNSQNNSMTTSVSSPSPSHCATVKQSTDADSAESSLQSLNALNQILNDDLHSEILTSIYKNGICSTLDNSHIGCNITYPEDKCNNMHSLNGFLGDVNVTVLNSERKEKYGSYSLAEHVNNQIKCVDFINNLMDSNMQQLGIDQSSTFT